MCALLATLAVSALAAGAASAADVTIDPVTVGPTVISPTVTGTVDPDGEATQVLAEYSTDGGSWTATPAQDAGSGSSATPVSVDLPSLAEETTYSVRLRAESGGATSYSAQETFTTGTATLPTATVGDPGAVTIDSVDVSGTVNPRGNETTYHWEISPDEGVTWFATGAAGTEQPAGRGNAAVAVAATLTDLRARSGYYVRIVATNGVRTAVSNFRGFDTGGRPPTVTADGATAVGYSKATLTGTVNVHGTGNTDYYFEYGTDTTYGRRWVSGTYLEAFLLPGPHDPKPVSAPIAGLQPSTTYHYRVVAVNADGTAFSPDATFATGEAPPVLTSASAEAVTETGVTLNALADTASHGGTSRFYVTTASSPDTRVVAAQDLSATPGATTISARVEGLAPGTTYRFRAAATSATGTGFSDEVSFTTAGVPDRETPIVAPDPGASPFGCQAPRLVAPSVTVGDGGEATFTGTDLGVGGTVTVGGELADVRSWSPTRVVAVLPSGLANGAVATADCGRVSNAVALQIKTAPSNAFSLGTRKFTGTSGKLRVRVNGPGTVTVSGKRIGRVSASVKAKGTTTLKVVLTAKTRKHLRRAPSSSISAQVRVTFRPQGGTARTQTVTLRFARGGSR